MHSCSLCRRQIESHRVLAAKAENTYLVSLGAVPTLVSGIYDVYDKEDKEHDDDEEDDADSNDDDDEELEQDVGG